MMFAKPQTRPQTIVAFNLNFATIFVLDKLEYSWHSYKLHDLECVFFLCISIKNLMRLKVAPPS